MNIILCGYKTCGKTTLAKAYSVEHNATFIDTDELIKEAFFSLYGAKYSIGDIHQELGETAFRELEVESLSHLTQIENAVIATGGGMLNDARNLKHLQSLGKIIYLETEKNTLLQRIKNLSKPPSFIREDHIDEDIKHYLESRDANYQAAADHTLNTGNKSVADLVLEIYQYRCDYGK